MKIAFLFLIIDIIHNYKLWVKFFENELNDQWSIYVHQKKEVDIGWFNQYKLGTIVDTRWGDISLVKAQNLLMETALQDKSNEMFIFVSGTCVPIRTFDYIVSHLDVNYSYFRITPPSRSRYTTVSKYMTFDKFKKASQWCILNRKHASLLISVKNEMIEMFSRVFAADEHAYITTLSIRCPNEIIDQMTTMSNWDCGKQNKGYLKLGPKHYVLMDIFEYEKYINIPTIFFIRKIERKCLLYCDGYDSFPAQNIYVMDNTSVNNQLNLLQAYQICQSKNYGGFVFYKNAFYFREHNVENLFREKEKFAPAMLVLATTLEDRIIYDLFK